MALCILKWFDTLITITVQLHNPFRWCMMAYFKQVCWKIQNKAIVFFGLYDVALLWLYRHNSIILDSEMYQSLRQWKDSTNKALVVYEYHRPLSAKSGFVCLVQIYTFRKFNHAYLLEIWTLNHISSLSMPGTRSILSNSKQVLQLFSGDHLWIWQNNDIIQHKIAHYSRIVQHEKSQNGGHRKLFGLDCMKRDCPHGKADYGPCTIPRHLLCPWCNCKIRKIPIYNLLQIHIMYSFLRQIEAVNFTIPWDLDRHGHLKYIKLHRSIRSTP